MVTAPVVVGRTEAGEMVFTSSPGAGPSGMLKLMVSVVGKPLETLIASRNVHSVELQPPVPGSAVELTVKERRGQASHPLERTTRRPSSPQRKRGPWPSRYAHHLVQSVAQYPLFLSQWGKRESLGLSCPCNVANVA